MNVSPPLMAGVPTGYLVPIVPAPKPLATTVGVEIAPGLGVSLDGYALLVGPKQAYESFRMEGHPEYNLPVRTFEVYRQGSETRVDGYHDHQDYFLRQSGNVLQVEGETPLESFRTIYREDGFQVKSGYSNRSFQVKVQGPRASVVSGSGDGVRYQVTQEGNRTRVRCSQGDGNFTFDRLPDGTVTMDGPLDVQDFTFRPQGKGWLVEGFYPHQRYQIG